MKKVLIAAMLMSGIFVYGISEAVPTEMHDEKDFNRSTVNVRIFYVRNL